MKTKTIFKTLALAMMMPAMLLTTACSSSDDDAIINNENINNENTAKKGFTIPVTVNVTRQGDATTRATYNGTTNQLSFSSGDQLFVWGSNNTAGSFAGKLKWQSGGTFSGTITTEKVYTGTADELFSESDNYAVLLPDGYKTYGFLSAGDSYNSDIKYDYTKAFADSKAAAVEQFSCESTYDYDKGFALTPRNAILNFTITGLTASTGVNVVFTKGNLNIDKTVTTNESGTATFAIGVEDESDLKYCTLTVGGNIISLVSSSKKLYAGSIYNITRNVALTNVTASDIGKLIGADGRIYSTQAAATTAGTTAVAMIAYVGTESNCSHGLAIALVNVGNGNSWNNSNNNNGGKTAAELCSAWNTSKTVTGGTWRLPSVVDWQYMLVGCGATGPVNEEPSESFYMSYSGMATKLTAVDGAALTSFWTSTPSGSWAWYVNSVNAEQVLIRTGSQSGTNDVRACLAF